MLARLEKGKGYRAKNFDIQNKSLTFEFHSSIIRKR